MASADVINTLIAEAGGEGDAGLIAAAWAIQQRAAARGQTIDQVIKSGFDGYSNPGSGAVKAQQDPRLRAKVEQILAGVQNGSIPNPVPGADHFLSGDANPGWSKNMKLVATIGGHRFYASGNVPQAAYGPLIPPGELPEVASALATVPTPRPALPVTPSPNVAALRKSAPPSQLIPDTFAGLSKGKRYLSDEIGMSPVGGGKQTAPMFDAAYDERLGAMQLTQQPINSQGMAVGSSRPPAPIPKIPSPQLATQRARDPVLQAALNAKYPAQPLPPTSGIGAPPVTRPVQSVSVKVPPVPASVEERATARNRPIWQAQTKAETARLASLYANGGPTRPPAGPMTVEQMYAGIYPTKPGQFLIGSTDGLGPGNPNGEISTAVLTGQVNPQGLQVAQPMKPSPYPFTRPPSFAPTQMAQGKVAPIPFNRPTAVGTQLSTQPMPPMPIPRPPMGMGGAERPAPRPATMSPWLAFQRSLPSMPVLRPPTSPAAQKVWMTGFSDSGSSGGAHGGSENDKHRGEEIPTNSRSY